MSRLIVGGGARGEHELGPGILNEVAVFGATLQGQVNVLRGTAVVGTLASGAAVGTRAVLSSKEFPIAQPCRIQIFNPVDQLACEFSKFATG